MAKATRSKEVATKSKEIIKEQPAPVPSSLGVIQRGVSNSSQARDLMISIASDLITGALAPNIGSGVCNAIGKLLKIVEMEFKYGPKAPDAPNRFLVLASSSEETKSV